MLEEIPYGVDATDSRFVFNNSQSLAFTSISSRDLPGGSL